MSPIIPHRELRNNSSAILREVEAGESFTITNHGQAVAVLGPIDGEAAPPRARLAKISGRFHELESVQLEHPIQQTLDDLRGNQ